MWKKLWYLSVLVLFLLAFGMMVNVQAAQAQSGTSENGESCRSCHENLYLLHDTGKSFCLCAEEMTCTCCHGGNPDAGTAEEAHLGMTLSPVHAESIPCQQCHPEDADAHIEKFAAMAGVSSFHPPAPTQTAFAVIANPTSTAPAPLHWLESWQWIGLGGLGVGLIFLVVFGYRCWRADCLPKVQKSNP